MTSMKFIRRRINSVNAINQIMKAMNMVAAAKLQKAKANLDLIRPMSVETNRMIDNLRYADIKAENIFFEQRKVQNTAYIVITSDKGLCGAYNFNVAEKAFQHMNEEGKNEKVIVVGSKGNDFFRRRNKKILKKFTGVSDTTRFEEAEKIVDYITSLYVSGEVEEVYITYTTFKSALVYVPCVVKLLPIDKSDAPAKAAEEMKYDPDIKTFLDHAIPMYLNSLVNTAIIESATCEHAARMISMDSATRNATEIVEKLTRQYNRVRQAAITQEITEIVGSANMLN